MKLDKMSYKCCVVPQCKNTSINRPDKLFVSVPAKARRRKLWLTLAGRHPNSIVSHSTAFMCEDHFDMEKAVANFMKYKMGFSQKLLLADDAVPTKFHCQEDLKTRLSDLGFSREFDADQQNTGSDGSASPTAGPAEEMVEVKEELPEFVEEEMQASLHWTDQDSSLRESQPQTRVQPNTSAVPEVKEEVEEDDYRAMFFKIQEEVTALRIANQSLSEENQILTERNQKLAKDIDTLLEKNNKLATDIKYRNKEHDIFTERIRELTNQNQCFSEKIQRLTEKCNEEFQSEDMLSNKCDGLQRIENLMKRLQAVVEDNKCLNEERDRLVERNEKMAETVGKALEDIKMVLRGNRRRINCTAQGEDMNTRRKREQEHRKP